MTHRITICTSCRRKGTECRPGYELIEKLRQAIAQAGEAIPEDFEISGVACMAGCDHPCTVAYHGTKKATYLFGDIAPESDIEGLVAFAKQYAYLHDGWCAWGNRPGNPQETTLARIPAAIIAFEAGEVRAS